MDRTHRLFALVAVVLFVLASLLVVTAQSTSSSGQGTPPSTPLSQVASGHGPSLASLTDPASALSATLTAAHAIAAPALLTKELAQVAPTTIAGVWTALAHHDAKALAQVTPAISANCGTGGGWCISTTIATVALLVCGVTAAPTLGLGCLAAGIAVIAIGIYEVLFGQSASAQIGKQVEDLAFTLVDEAASMFQLAAIGVLNLVSALNATVNALGYEAAAAALSQLGNSSFNEPLDLAQSGIAAQLAGVLAAQMATISQLTGQFEATAAEELGSANSESFSCSIGIAGEYNPLDSGGSPISCPSSAPSSYTYTNGALSAGIFYASTATTEMWLQHGEPMTIQAGTPVQRITLIPMDGSTPFYNLTITTAPQYNVTFLGPSNAYRAVWSAGATAEFFPAISMPLSSADFPSPTSQLEQYALIDGASFSLWGRGALQVSGFGSCFGFFTCANTYGDTPSANSTAYAPQWLFTLAVSAATQGEVYWLTLRNLGYTSANQVPARCLIPSPAQLLPQDLTPTQLASLNATAMLRIYYALLGNLAYTFNASSEITSFNVCGHHVTLPTGSSPIGFGTYGYGYLYNPANGTIRNANGTVGQVYGNPETWNYSGVVSLAPAIGAFTVPIGTPWLLPDDNPSFATVQAFGVLNGTADNHTNSKTGVAEVVANGPTQCAVASPPAMNCSLDNSPLQVLDYLGGNSSANHGITGSAFPTHEDGSGAGWSLYLTACFTAQANAGVQNVSYTETLAGGCAFDHNTINSTVYFVCSGGEFVFNISSCPTPPPILVVGSSTGLCGTGGLTAWYDAWIGSIVSGIAGPFQGIPLIGAGLGCILGWVAVIAIFVIIVIAIIFVIRFVRGR